MWSLPTIKQVKDKTQTLADGALQIEGDSLAAPTDWKLFLVQVNMNLIVVGLNSIVDWQLLLVQVYMLSASLHMLGTGTGAPSFTP